ncbi:MAG: L-seryl-tRNA(Sec) selenium transferase [Terrisporobacter sp.]|uniref:L-seryl-tRNA(Sec) selenium transferase n=1 Tax=Terrisporobacter sp. TaxID=1965305 RepID=UPI002FC6ED36
MNKNMLFRNIPKVDILLENAHIISLIEKYNREVVVDVIRDEIEELRNFIKENDDINIIEKKIENLVRSIEKSVEKIYAYNLKKVINGTGTILHTNLGRAIISKKHAQYLSDVVTSYSNLEYNLDGGKRGERYSHFEELICKITGAESCMAVNNNAAAVMLVLSSMACEKEVIVSRGELVEVGGKFRIPDVMASSNAKLVEIGTTNKTHLEDYEDAITEDTGALLKVHTSNFKILGFTESVSLQDLCNLGKEKDIPVIEDIGSGVLIDLSKYGLEYEPTVQDSIKAGVDVVSFSGDKLLGGPQAGIIVGKKKYIDKMKKNPLTRAFRIDKFTAIILEMIFKEYLSEENAIKNIPVLSLITKKTEKIEENAIKLYDKLESLKEVAVINIEHTLSQIGGGSLPAERLNSKCVSIKPLNISTAKLEEELRLNENPVVARIEHDKLIIDMRTILENEIDILSQKLINILSISNDEMTQSEVR